MLHFEDWSNLTQDDLDHAKGRVLNLRGNIDRAYEYLAKDNNWFNVLAKHDEDIKIFRERYVEEEISYEKYLEEVTSLTKKLLPEDQLRSLLQN